MEERLKELYLQEIEKFHLNFDSNLDYQKYYTQAAALWEEEDIPEPVYSLLETSNFLSFIHGIRLGAQLADWLRTGQTDNLPPSAPAGTFFSFGKEAEQCGGDCLADASSTENLK